MKKYSLTILLILAVVVSVCYTAYAMEKPDDVYKRYFNAIKKGDMKTMMSCVCKEQRAQMEKAPESQKKMLFGMIRAMQPVSYKILRRHVHMNKATLFMEGMEKAATTGGKDVPTKGTVSFVKEDGKWMLLKETWKTTVK